jgi:prephenate dehydrogenase
MRFDTLALVGVGLLGGSVGLAVRRRGIARRVVGTDCDAANLDRARARGILDATFADAAAAVAAADLVVFCTPVDRIGPLILAAAPHCRPGTLLTDVGSTKTGIVRAVEGRLPSGVAFVGSHPLAGSEKHGPEWSDADLFEGRLVVLTPCQSTRDRGVPRADLDRAAAFWQALGARVRVMEPEEHDRALALTSHLPHLTASALAATVPAELLDLSATGFRDATRLAAGSPDVWTAILHANRDAVLAALDAYRDRLDLFRRALESADRALIAQLLGEGRQLQDA